MPLPRKATHYGVYVGGQMRGGSASLPGARSAANVLRNFGVGPTSIRASSYRSLSRPATRAEISRAATRSAVFRGAAKLPRQTRQIQRRTGPDLGMFKHQSRRI